jgi:hypothetical protein
MKRCMQLFFDRNRESPDALCEQLGMLFGAPIPTTTLAAQLNASTLDAARSSYVSIEPSAPAPLPLPPPPPEPASLPAAAPSMPSAPTLAAVALGPSGRFYAACPSCEMPNYGDLPLCMGCHKDLTAK